MRLTQWASIGLIGLVSAKDSNGTLNSRDILPSVFRPPQHFRNVNLVRNINLDKNHPQETINVVVENIDKAPQSDYYLPFELDVLSRVGGLEVKDKKNPERRGFSAKAVGTELDAYDHTARSICYEQS